ncbi:hypothetical protein [Novosphingobium sp. PhB165]|uniref:hypothetical protein n=1 Tax=Novosphingobium sp. PhB165 TaxID=2485105 RepID=UPI00104BFD83|nr:hypothetical protein [Novosphingobium sp. PhB165]
MCQTSLLPRYSIAFSIRRQAASSAPRPKKFTVSKVYRPASNILGTGFATNSGKASFVESLNSGTAGRLPWWELARRIEGEEGEVQFEIELRFRSRAGHVLPYVQKIGRRGVFHVGVVLGLFLHSDGIHIERSDGPKSPLGTARMHHACSLEISPLPERVDV